MNLIGGRTRAQNAAHNHWLATQDIRLSEMSDRLAADAAAWRETELPKIRARMLAAGYVTVEAIKDNIVSAAELLADPHEIWRRDVWSHGWVRVEIEG